jgi:hypothetical protein
MAVIRPAQPYIIDDSGLDLLHSFGFTVESGNIHHTHPISALLRNGFEDYVFREHPGQLVKDIGGNPARHAKYNGRAKNPRMVHCCCPYTCPADIIREVSRVGISDPSVTTCRNRFSSGTGTLGCSVNAPVYMFNHSMYYIGRRELLGLPVGTTIYSMHHVYPGSGTYCNGEIEVSMVGDQVRAHSRGNDLPYVHPNCWLSGECVIPGADGSVIAFKLLAKYETCLVFKGIVMDVPYPFLGMYSEPPPALIEEPWNELEKYLLAEIVGTTLDSRTVHALHARARTYCVTKNRRIPHNLTETITRVMNESASLTIAMHERLNTEDIRKSNQYVSDLVAEEPTVEKPWYRRVGGSVVQICGLTVRGFGYVVGTPLCKAGRKIVDISRYSYTKYVSWRSLVNYDPLVEVVPHVPQRCWENEFAAIVNRAIPPQMQPRIDQCITRAAMQLASSIGRVETPILFEDWVARFPSRRREELQKTRNENPCVAGVRMFLKVEKLDSLKDPRAIQARVDAFKVHAGPWVAAMEKRATEALPIFIKGLAPAERAEKIQQLKLRALNTLEIDFQRFDRHCSRALLEATEHLIYHHVFPDQVADLLKLTLDNKVESFFGAKYEVDGTRMSGDVTTSIGNCLVVACLMVAAGLPLDSFVVEGDDMIAAVTDTELCGFNVEVIKATGMKPEVVQSHNAGTFCSRYDVTNSRGEPARVRHPLRDITRFGTSIHDAKQVDLVRAHAEEWNGVPMLGPIYVQRLFELSETEKDDPKWITEISPIARASFHLTFDIGPDDQLAFETDPQSRQQIFDTLQDAKNWAADCSEAADAPPPTPATAGDVEGEIPGTLDPSRGGQDGVVRVPPWRIRDGSPRRSCRFVRNVQDTRSEVSVQVCGGHHHER